MTTTAEDELRARLDALEIAAAHHEETIADLNRTVTAQWTEIDALKRLVRALADHVDEAVGGARDGGPDKPPPHY